MPRRMEGDEDDDFNRVNEETPKVINFIEKVEHLKNITKQEEDWAYYKPLFIILKRNYNLKIERPRVWTLN